MLVSLTELRSYRVECTDGDIGRIDDLIFFRGEWVVRYVVADAEEMGTRPFLDVADIDRVDLRRHVLRVNLSQDDVANARTEDIEPPPPDKPEEDGDEDQEICGWPPFWRDEERKTPAMGPGADEEEPGKNPDVEEFEGPQPQLANDLAGSYSIQTDGGETGTLRDFIIEGQTWKIPYLVVDMSLPARRVLLATDYVQRVDWLAGRMHVSLSMDDIAASPVFHSDEPITPEFERRLYEYYDAYSR